MIECQRTTKAGGLQQRAMVPLARGAAAVAALATALAVGGQAEELFVLFPPPATGQHRHTLCGGGSSIHLAASRSLLAETGELCFRFGHDTAGPALALNVAGHPLQPSEALCFDPRAPPAAVTVEADSVGLPGLAVVVLPLAASLAVQEVGPGPVTRDLQLLAYHQPPGFGAGAPPPADGPAVTALLRFQLYGSGGGGGGGGDCLGAIIELEAGEGAALALLGRAAAPPVAAEGETEDRRWWAAVEQHPAAVTGWMQLGWRLLDRGRPTVLAPTWCPSVRHPGCIEDQPAVLGRPWLPAGPHSDIDGVVAGLRSRASLLRDAVAALQTAALLRGRGGGGGLLTAADGEALSNGGRRAAAGVRDAEQLAAALDGSGAAQPPRLAILYMTMRPGGYDVLLSSLVSAAPPPPATPSPSPSARASSKSQWLAWSVPFASGRPRRPTSGTFCCVSTSSRRPGGPPSPPELRR